MQNISMEIQRGNGASVQLNKFELDQYFLQNFQCTTMLIHAFCKICKPEIVFVYFLSVNFCFDFFRTISGSQLLQNTWIIKQTGVLLWKNWRKYGCVSYWFSCIMYNSQPKTFKWALWLAHRELILVLYD